MNTKGIKFLAVLAVLAMAFAVFATIAPAESDDADTTNVEDLDGLKNAITAGATDITIKTGFTIDSEVTIPAGTTVTIAGSQTVTVSSVLTNNGTIVNNANSAYDATYNLIVSGDGAELTSTGTGIISGTASPLVVLTQGTVEEQKVFPTDAANEAIWVKDDSDANKTAELSNIEVVMIKDGHGIAFGHPGTIKADSISFTSESAVSTENLFLMNNGKTPTTLTIRNMSVKNVTPDTDFHAYFSMARAGTIAPVGSDVTNANYYLDSSVKTIALRHAAFELVDDMTFDKVYIKSDSRYSAATLKVAKDVLLEADVILNKTEGKLETLTLKEGTPADPTNSTAAVPGAAFEGTVTYGTDSAAIVLMAGIPAVDNRESAYDVTISAGSIIITGTIGALDGSKIEQISGDVALNLTVPEETTLDIAGKITGNIADAGTVNLDTGVDISDLSITTSGSGKIVDNTDEDDMEELVIGGNSQGASTEFSSEQKVIVSSELGYWTLNSGSIVKINGVLVIPEGTIMTVQADAQLIIQAGAKVHVYGELVLDAKEIGNDKAGIMTVNKGFVSVEGNMTVNGELSLSATDAIISEIDVENGGRVIIGEAGKFTVTDKAEFYVAAGGELLVYGTMGTAIYNSGMIIVDSEIAVTESTKIYMWSPDAMVDVRNYTINANSNADLTITDEGLVFLTYKSGDNEKYVTLDGAIDKVVIGMEMTSTPAAGDSKENYSITFSGIEIVSGSTSKASTTEKAPESGIYNYKQYSKYLDVSGTFFVDYTYIGTTTGSEQTVKATVESYTDNGTLKAQCAVKVTDAIVLNDNVTLTNKTGVLTVTGSIDTMSDKAKVTNTEGATITVDKAGEISVVGGIINTENGINAAKFVTVGTDISGKTYKIYNYYSIDGALAAVSSGVETTEIIILGSQTLTLSETLPDGITLVLSNSTASLIVKADVAFTIADTAVVKGEGTITVNGSMYAEEKTSVKGTVKVVSDVKTEELDEKGKPTKTGWALWTNLAAAIAAAEPGSVITITKIGLVSISNNLTIPEDITLVIPSTSEGVILSNGVTLTINGIVVVGKDSNIWAQQSFALDAQNITAATTETDKSRQSSAIVVNGALFSEKAVEYGNGYAAMNTVAGNGKKIALFDGTYATGAKYTTDGTSAATMPDKVVAPIAGAYYTVKDGSTTYNVISSLAFAAVLADEFTSANITIHGDVSGLILDFEGTDVLKSIVIGGAGESITTPTRTGAVATELTVATLVLNDLILDATNGAFSGIVGNGTDAITLYDAKGITVQDADDKLYINGTMTFATTDGFAVISAGTVYLGKATGFTTEKTLTVGDDATAIVENEVTITGILFVEGTFQVPAGKTATITYLYDLGVVDVAATTETTSQGTLNIDANGFMYIGCDGIPAAEKTEFEIAYLNGPISFGNKASVYVMDDAVVDLEASACLLALKHTTFFIEDDEFFTEFAKGDVTLDTTIPKILDAVISKWVDEDGDNVDGQNVGAVDEVYALINYNIYSVMIVTDAGVKSVAINGIEMVSQGNNVFTLGVDEEDILTPLIAGTYKVTYTLKAGYQEDKNGVALYTEDGTILANHSFVAGGSDEEITIKLQLNGTEIIPEPEPVTPEEQSEWTITTILLVILVILIAIMAVIVALRLNRN